MNPCLCEFLLVETMTPQTKNPNFCPRQSRQCAGVDAGGEFRLDRPFDMILLAEGNCWVVELWGPLHVAVRLLSKYDSVAPGKAMITRSLVCGIGNRVSYEL